SARSRCCATSGSLRVKTPRVPSERFPVRLPGWRKDLDVTLSSRSRGRRVIDTLLSAPTISLQNKFTKQFTAQNFSVFIPPNPGLILKIRATNYFLGNVFFLGAFI